MKIDTKTKLIEIATQFFAKKGYSAVSIREVTEAAQVNVSAISYYFSGKEGLYAAVLEQQFAPIAEALKLTQNKKNFSPTERLQFYGEYALRIHTQRPLLVRFIGGEVVNPTKYGRAIIEDHLSQLFKFIQTALRDGIKEGCFREDLDLTYTSISLISILNFYFVHKPLIQKIAQLPENANNEYSEQALQIFLQGILTSTDKK